MNSHNNGSSFMNPTQSFLMSPDIPNLVSGLPFPSRVTRPIADVAQIPDDFAMWDMEFWNPLLQNGT